MSSQWCKISALLAVFCFPYQVAETSEEGVGQHEFPSLLYLLGNGLVDVVRGKRAEGDGENDASQPHLPTCVPGG